jgi:hypothetical protein
LILIKIGSSFSPFTIKFRLLNNIEQIIIVIFFCEIILGSGLRLILSQSASPPGIEVILFFLELPDLVLSLLLTNRVVIGLTTRLSIMTLSGQYTVQNIIYLIINYLCRVYPFQILLYYIL